MKNFTKTLLLVLFFIYGVATAQQEDILKINRNDKGTITFVRFGPSKNRAISKAKNLLKKILKTGSKDELPLKKEFTDKYGFVHRRYQQYYSGIKVEGAQYLVDGKGGIIKSINGHYRKINISSTSPQVTEERALEKALAYVDAKKYKWEVERVEQF